LEQGQPHQTAPQTRGLSDLPSPVEQQLLVWQESGEHVHLEGLLVTILPLAERVAKAALYRFGIHDPSSVDEAISLVLDHLRRLPGSAAGARVVTPFTPRNRTAGSSFIGDAGTAYLVWLVRERAADVARAHRRHRKHATVFSVLDKHRAGRLHERVADEDAACDTVGSQTSRCVRLYDALPHLPARERQVIDFLLEGKSQVAISHVLDVCEGTVSRLRMRAITLLRDLLAE
jgi:RNA polymerase sigma factor (sigma-70 family)